MKCSECEHEDICYNGQYQDDCNVCSGTGEGYTEYSTCWNCHGRGTEIVTCDEGMDEQYFIGSLK